MFEIAFHPLLQGRKSISSVFSVAPVKDKSDLMVDKKEDPS